MTGTDYRREVEDALASSAPVTKADYLRWAIAGDLETQARAYDLSASAWDRIKPEPSMEEQCRFMAAYLLACVEENPESDEYLQNGFEAGYALAAWVKHLHTIPDAAGIITNVAGDLERLYRKLDALGRNRIETAALEHILEAPGLRPYFEHWQNDSTLREAYEPALEWGLAHSDDG